MNAEKNGRPNHQWLQEVISLVKFLTYIWQNTVCSLVKTEIIDFILFFPIPIKISQFTWAQEMYRVIQVEDSKLFPTHLPGIETRHFGVTCVGYVKLASTTFWHQTFTLPAAWRNNIYRIFPVNIYTHFHVRERMYMWEWTYM